jgi:co-chaperonin GroES (HSP10)
LANTQVQVVQLPFDYDGPVGVGTTLLIDATVVLTMMYNKTGEHESIHMVDREKGFYRVDKSMIIAYQLHEKDWVGFNEHVLIERIPYKHIQKGPLKIPINQKFEKGKGVLVAGNNELEGAIKGDAVYFNEMYCVEVWLNEKSYLWVRNRDVFAVEEKLSA